jgi:phosphohistidine phosphatase
MLVFLIRHAIAHERNRVRWPNDGLRPLTTGGIRKFRKAAYGISRNLPKRAVLLTSPYVRARETAAILAEALGSSKPIECGELTPGESPHTCFALLRKRKEEAVVLVGHEPDLSTFVVAALAGTGARMKIEFKKGAAVCLEFAGRIEAGRATLKWMLPPRVLRAMR